MMEDKQFYDQAVAPEAIPAWADEVRLYVENWLDDARHWFGGRTDVRILDLGAGSCTTSLILSRETFVAEIVAADLSTARMQQMVPHTQAIFGGIPAKLRFEQIDMNRRLDFPDDHFDLVLMDAALHHSRNIWLTLAEIRRILKPRGYFVAQREHYVSPLTAGYSFRKLLRTDEVKAGVSENAYLKSQYDYYLRANGFEPRFKPVFTHAKFKLLAFANGWLFSKYNILARSTREEAGEAAGERPQPTADQASVAAAGV
jgi:ubiquinone/menaquinone biosynthesis C-methylase UbiE